MQFTDQHRALDETVTRFVRQEIDPHVEAWERAEQFPSREIFKKLGDLGL
ncbi:MAG: acyl-CoA dehydrogenase family protein, partial [Actinobacteria bacterium]|nr:acyl-CoA dehydrogenase family protein [Actinomycetota bacterium]